MVLATAAFVALPLPSGCDVPTGVLNSTGVMSHSTISDSVHCPLRPSARSGAHTVYLSKRGCPYCGAQYAVRAGEPPYCPLKYPLQGHTSVISILSEGGSWPAWLSARCPTSCCCCFSRCSARKMRAAYHRLHVYGTNGSKNIFQNVSMHGAMASRYSPGQNER